MIACVLGVITFGMRSVSICTPFCMSAIGILRLMKDAAPLADVGAKAAAACECEFLQMGRGPLFLPSERAPQGKVERGFVFRVFVRRDLAGRAVRLQREHFFLQSIEQQRGTSI